VKGEEYFNRLFSNFKKRVVLIGHELYKYELKAAFPARGCSWHPSSGDEDHLNKVFRNPASRQERLPER